MAITFVGYNAQSAINITLVGLVLPASLPNDLVIVISGCSATGGGGPPSTSGYTQIVNLNQGTGNGRLNASYKFMGATPDTSVTVQFAGGGDAVGVLALVFRGVSTTTPVDVAAVTLDWISAPRAPQPPAITTVTADCCIVAASSAKNLDTSVGSISGFLPSPGVQITGDGSTNDITVAAAYYINTGPATTTTPTAWTTWTSVSPNLGITFALRPITASTDFNTVDKANVTTTGKAVVQVEKVAVSKYRMIYTGRTVNIPDSSVEAIFVDKYRMVITGQTVNPFDTFRAVTVDKASVLYRGRNVTVREVQFEDIPKYTVKGRGAGHWMETR